MFEPLNSGKCTRPYMWMKAELKALVIVSTFGKGTVVNEQNLHSVNVNDFSLINDQNHKDTVVKCLLNKTII